jgi:hypothetical protein
MASGATLGGTEVRYWRSFSRLAEQNPMEGWCLECWWSGISPEGLEIRNGNCDRAKRGDRFETRNSKLTHLRQQFGYGR